MKLNDTCLQQIISVFSFCSTARVKKQSPVHFTVLPTYVDQFAEYLAQSILKKYATQKLLICPSHLHNAAALPWEKLNFSFQYFEPCFIW